MFNNLFSISKKINAFNYASYTNEELLQKINTKNDFELLAIIKEATKRTLNKTPYDVQMIGAKTIIDGSIAEMKTGEGKSLTAAIVATFKALRNQHVFVVTVNDYLSIRDAEEHKPLFDFFKLSSGSIATSKTEYQNKIVYATNTELGFDYLRDNMVHNKNEKIQGDLDFALIDEIDSILIDEARIPLILSGSIESGSINLVGIDMFAKTLIEIQDFTIDRKANHLNFTDQGIDKVEKFFNIHNLYENSETSFLAHLIEQALLANYMFFNGVHYLVQDNELVLIDENTGRLSPGKQLSNGLHQAIEVKESLPISVHSTVLGKITYQNFFKLFKNISGMTGTAKTEEKEFWDIYKLKVVSIPTHKPILRNDRKELFFTSLEAKTLYLVELIKQNKGQPILIGTDSVKTNEFLASVLKKEGFNFNVLNAKNAKEESEIIAKAGEFGTITLTTNMAGRGVDIKLDEKSKEAGGLFVIGFQKYENRRIDNQLSGRSGRQGDPGISQFLVSLDDDIIKYFGAKKFLNVLRNLDVSHTEELQSSFFSKGILNAQKAMEQKSSDIRKELVKYDSIISKQREVIFKIRDNIIDENYDFVSKLPELFEFISTKNNVGDLKEMTEKAINNITSMEDPKKSLKQIYLNIIDGFWIEHLTVLEELQKGIGFRSMTNKDPFIEFNKEAFHLFDDLLTNIRIEIFRTIAATQAG